MNPSQFIVILGGGNYAAPIWEDYSTYVLADGGTAENRDCTINAIARLI